MHEFLLMHNQLGCVKGHWHGQNVLLSRSLQPGLNKLGHWKGHGHGKDYSVPLALYLLIVLTKAPFKSAGAHVPWGACFQWWHLKLGCQPGDKLWTVHAQCSGVQQGKCMAMSFERAQESGLTQHWLTLFSLLAFEHLEHCLLHQIF